MDPEKECGTLDYRMDLELQWDWGMLMAGVEAEG